MENLILNKFFCMFINALSCELMLYLFICNSFQLRINKNKAYRYAILCSLFMPATDTLFTLLVGGKLIPLTVSMIVLMKTITFLSELILLVFLYFSVDRKWYQYYWGIIILHFVFALPYALVYCNYFMIDDGIKGFDIRPISYDNILLYLFFLFINVAWGFIIIKISRLIKPIKKLDQVSKLSWSILYLLWVVLILQTDKYLDSQEYQRVLKINTDKDLFAWFSTVDEVVIYVFVIGFIIIASIYISERKHLKIENILLRDMNEIQYENYLAMHQQELEIHKLYHDIGNHIETIQILVNSGEHKEAEAYTGNLISHYRNIRKHYFCSNRIINAVLLQKFKVCEHNHIEYEADIKLPEELPFRDIDLMSTLSNLMDNAIESCQRNVGVDNRIIVRLGVIGNYFTIKIINTKSFEKINKSDTNNFITWKADKKMHGYGLKILTEIIKRYDGEKELKDSGNEFSAMVMLKIPENVNQRQKLHA